MDFLAYLIFMSIGIVLGAAAGLYVMRRIWSGSQSSEWVFWAAVAGIVVYALRRKYS